MSDKSPDDRLRTPSNGKSAWVRPVVEVAKAKGASAFGGPSGSIDYGLYS